MSISQRTINRNNFRKHWLTRLNEAPFDIVAKEYAHLHKKGYAFAEHVLNALKNIDQEKEQEPLCRVFEAGQKGVTECGKNFKITKVTTQEKKSGKNCLKVLVQALLDSGEVVFFNCQGLSEEGYKIASLNGIPVENCADLAMKSQQADAIHISLEEVPFVKAFLKAIRTKA